MEHTVILPIVLICMFFASGFASIVHGYVTRSSAPDLTAANEAPLLIPTDGDRLVIDVAYSVIQTRKRPRITRRPRLGRNPGMTRIRTGGRS